MSRIGRLPIPVPPGSTSTSTASHVTVKGPKGTLSHAVAAPIDVAKDEDGTLQVDPARRRARTRARCTA